MSRYSSEIASIFDDADREASGTCLFSSEKVTFPSIVLRGHLVLEELLYQWLQSHCLSPEHLDEARLRFSQLVPLVRALQKIPVGPPSLWQSLNKLNAFRNALAHNLEPPCLFEKVSDFASCSLGTERTAALTSPDDSLNPVAIALCFLLGQLEAFGVFAKSVEYIIAKRVFTGSD